MDWTWILVYLMFSLVIGAAYFNILLARFLVRLLLPGKFIKSQKSQNLAILLLAVLISILITFFARRQICYVWDIYN